MSLKTTPKGLLAALAALCIILLQAPAVHGSVASAAQAGTPRAAAPAHHAAASHSGVRPRTINPGSSQTSTFSNTGGRVASLTPITGPVGTPITVTGTITPATPVTLTATDANGTFVNFGSQTSGSSGSFTFAVTVPTTFTFGTATITATISATQTATFSFGVNQPSLSVSPSSATRCATAMVAITDVAPGQPITPTFVFTNAGVMRAVPFTSSSVTPPIAQGSSSEGNTTSVITIPTTLPYSVTGVISLSAPYPVTPTSLPSFAIPVTPTITVNSPAGAGLTAGPLGPGFTTGTTNTLNLISNNSFQPNSGITLTVALSGSTSNVLGSYPSVATDGTGAFTATAPFSVSTPGTYNVTANDVGSCNVASATITVAPAAAAGPPVATQFFAEGYTGSGKANGKANYQTVYDVLNPNVTSVLITDTYLIEPIGYNEDITTTTAAPDVVVVTHTLPALADVQFDARTEIASTAVMTGPDAGKIYTVPGGVPGAEAKFATEIQTAGFQGTGATAGLGGIVRGVAAERLIVRTANSGARYDGDVSLGATAANTSYYFAEGYTGGNFQEYLLLFNPSPTVTATVSVLRVPQGTAASAISNTATSPVLVDSQVLAPLQRLTLNVRRLNATATGAQRSIGLIVNSADNPVVAERAEYFGPGMGSGRPGETIAAGLTTAAKQLIFAYGSLTAATPDVVATITPTGDIAQTIDDRPFIEVVNPNIAGQIVAGTVSGSAAAPGPAAHVTIQLRGENGRLLGFFFTDVDAGARFTLTYDDLTNSSSGIGFPGVPTGAPTRAGVFSAVVSSSERVVAEEAQYYGQGGTTPSGDANSGAPGLDLVGAPTGETNVLFPALGTTDPGSPLPLSNAVFLYNPGVNTVRINGTFFGPTGVVAHQVYTIRPDAIAVIGQASSFSAGTAISPTASIPAGTTGAEFTTVQQRGSVVSGEPGQAPETFVAAAVTHSQDATNWWGTQGLYPLPTLCSTSSGAPLPSGCP